MSPPTSWAICVQPVFVLLWVTGRPGRLSLWVAASPALCCLILHAVILLFSHPLVFQVVLLGEFVF